MEKIMNNNISSRLTFQQRCKIEEMVNKRHRKFEIANELDKSPSTIAREIKRHRKLKPNTSFNDNNYNCKFFVNCKVCTGKCNIFQPISCSERDRTIGACNNCSKLRSCKLDKYFYIADSAQKDYEYTLVDSRLGVNLTRNQLVEIANIICPLIKKRSIYLYYLN